MRIRHILIALDLADHGERVFDEGLRLALRHRSRVTLVHAIERDARFNEHAGPRRATLAAMARRARAQGLRVRVSIQQGDPAGVILLHARARGVDLIVLGTSGRRGLARFRHGSVAEWVVSGAPCAALVVPGTVTPETLDRRDGAVLAAVDLSVGSRAMVEQSLAAARLVGAVGAPVTFLHVVEALPPSATPRYGWRLADPEYRQYLHLSAWRHLQSTIPSAARTAGKTLTRVVAGHPGDQIGAVAEDVAARLIIIGATRTGAWRLRLFEPTAAKVLRTAPCPVLILPAAAADSLRAAA
jgi:nucleotide-binding universal stress UspA family protein